MAEKIVLPNARYESRDITGRGIIFALVLLVGSLATVGLVVWGLFPHSTADTRITEGVAAFPSPRLQPDPQEDWARFHRAELQQLNSFGWVDKANGIVHIPIDDAMRQVAARGDPGLAGRGRAEAEVTAVNFHLAAASNFAPQVDRILICLLAISAAMLVMVFGLMWTFMIKYRAGSPIDRGNIAQRTWRIEIAWTAATFIVFIGLFYWGAGVYLDEYQPPAGTMKVSVVGKRWMWKMEYPGGQREINSLHVPVGRKVQLILTSEDVIHDFAIPAFRVRHDVLPGRYETIWFIAETPGTYELFCTQLCGAEHSRMRGEVVAMKPADYQRWLEQTGSSQTLVAAGQELFIRFGCSGCHNGGGTVRAPSLAGVFNSPVPLSDGTTVIADEGYLRDSILYPKKQVVASYQPVMPSFDGKISDADLEKLIAYIKSLGAESHS